MTSRDLESVALTLVAEGKGILAADETIPTLTRRFDTLGIQSTEQSRRTYRDAYLSAAPSFLPRCHHVQKRSVEGVRRRTARRALTARHPSRDQGR